MGYLGFLFEIDGVEKVVFVNKKNFDCNIVVGIKEKVVLNEIKTSQELSDSEGLGISNSLNARILDYNLSLNNFPIFSDAKFLYGKISVAKETFVDYENLTIWFNANKYKKLRQLFEEHIEDDKELIKRVVEIYAYFK